MDEAPFIPDPKYSAADIAEYQRRMADAPPAKPKPNGHHPVTSRILPSADFVRGFVPPDYVVDGILQRGFCYSFTALTGSGKTAVTLLLMAHIALGRPLNGREVRRGNVLMLAGENADDVRMRWIALAEQASFDDTEIAAYFMPGVFSLAEQFPDIAALAEKIGGLHFISVDTSAAYFQGEDENSNRELGDHARLIRELTKLPGNPCVLANCHPVKNAAADNLLPRGGGAFLNEVDGNLCCSKTDMVVEVHWQGKFRGPEFDPIAFELCSVTSDKLRDTKGKPVPTVVARTITSFEQEAKTSAGDQDARTMLKLLNDGPNDASVTSLAERAGWLMGNGQAYKVKAARVLSRLKRQHLVTNELNVWEVTPKGLKIIKARG